MKLDEYCRYKEIHTTGGVQMYMYWYVIDKKIMYF